MQVRDRIKELRRVRASELRPNPRNWRSHPERQRRALAGVLAEIGYVDALLARELPDGGLMLVDGHLRAETTPDSLVPVLVLDVDEAEADQILLMLDPLAGLAGTDETRLAELLSGVESRSAVVRELLATAAAEYAAPLPSCASPPAVVPSPSAAVDDLLGSITASGSSGDDRAAKSAAPPRTGKTRRRRQPAELREVYQVIVECSDEEDQRTVYEQMREEGYPCRVLTL